MPRPAAKPERALSTIGTRLRWCGLSLSRCLHPLPQLIVDDAEVRDLNDEIALRTVVTPDSGTANRILGIDPPTPDHPANIELVSQQPIASHGPSTDR